MADVWVNSMECHPRATCHIAGCSHLEKSMSWSCHIAGCNNSIRHIENRFFRHILFFCYFNAIWALTSGGFRVVSDTLVVWVGLLGNCSHFVFCAPMFHLLHRFLSITCSLLLTIPMMVTSILTVHFDIWIFPKKILTAAEGSGSEETLGRGYI